MTVYMAISLMYDRRDGGQRFNIENIEHTTGVVLPGEGGIEGGGGREAAAGPRDRLGVVAIV